MLAFYDSPLSEVKYYMILMFVQEHLAHFKLLTNIFKHNGNACVKWIINTSLGICTVECNLAWLDSLYYVNSTIRITVCVHCTVYSVHYIGRLFYKLKRFLFYFLWQEGFIPLDVCLADNKLNIILLISTTIQPVALGRSKLIEVICLPINTSKSMKPSCLTLNNLRTKEEFSMIENAKEHKSFFDRSAQKPVNATSVLRRH